MFDGIVHGLYRAGIDYEEFEFFLQHQEQDVVRCEWLQELLLTVLQTDADMACLEAGALRSLEMHCRFWDAVQARIAAWKRGRLIPVGPPDPAGMTLGALRRL
jgi:hypothetical protein